MPHHKLQNQKKHSPAYTKLRQSGNQKTGTAGIRQHVESRPAHSQQPNTEFNDFQRTAETGG
ncbi:MAG: hypothetical protein LBH04_12605, partial [Tannerellaceae bacterium]|nr:hypothetical protein [Tannerellaceae bacterium]